MDTLSQRGSLGLSSIFNQAFAWMFAGLMLTAVTSLALASNTALFEALYSNPILFYGAIVAELGLVIFLSFRITKMSYTTALASFLLYAILNGITLSAILFVYTSGSIASTFFTAAGVFGAMAVYGYTTKQDLTGIGSFAIMALVGVIILSLVNIFLRSDFLGYALSFIGLAIFIGLTIYDVQKIKQMSEETTNQNLGIMAALTLYLDFINIFLNLLRILGKRR